MDPSTDPIRTYIRANKERLTPEAIRSQLIQAGHDPARVDAAWQEEWQPPSPWVTAAEEPPASGLSRLAWGLYILGALIGGSGALLLAGFAPMYGDSRQVPLFLVMYAVAYLGLGYMVLRVVRWAVPEFNVRGAGAALLGLALVPLYGGLMFGTCIATYSLAGTGG